MFLGGQAEFDSAFAIAGILNIRRRLPSGADETITFPAVDYNDAVMVQFDPNMTHVTFGIMV